jgi:hypothetical protein
VVGALPSGANAPARVRAVAWLPVAPVLVPEIGGPDGGDPELVRLRAAVGAAVARVVASEPAVITAVAPTATAVEADGSAVWSWHGFGVGARLDPAATQVLPWPLGLAARLLDDAGWQGSRRYLGVTGRQAAGPGGGGGGDGVDRAHRRAAVADPEPAGLLVLGDGSACRNPAAPGGHDPRAAAWDAQLASLLAAGDPAGLAELDPALGAELMSAAAVTFPAAGALLAAVGTPQARRAQVSYDAAPYGVGYLVSTWMW